MRNWRFGACDKYKSFLLHSTAFILEKTNFAITGVWISLLLEVGPRAGSVTGLLALQGLDVFTAGPALSVPGAAPVQSRPLRPIPRTSEGASYGRSE